MRTTIDLPDDLLRRAKATAALKGLKLKDYIAGILARALTETNEVGPKIGRDTPIPVVIPATGITIPYRTNAEMYEMLDQEEDERHGRSA